jgi:hypothetical protein
MPPMVSVNVGSADTSLLDGYDNLIGLSLWHGPFDEIDLPNAGQANCSHEAPLAG